MPIEVTNEHLEFLDVLRSSGVVNMFEATSYIQDQFDMNREDSSHVLAIWMETFGDRLQAGEVLE